VRILHISDLHYRADDDDDRTPILRAVAEDLIAFRTEAPFDAAIFTGDLVFAGTSPEVFHDAFDQCITPILKSADLSTTQLVIVPGNHDINRDEVDLAEEEQLRPLLQTLDKVNEFVDDALRMPNRTRRLANFYSFINDLWPASTQPDTLGGTHYIETSRGTLSVSAANTAWRSTGRPDDADRHLLHVSERQLQALAQALQPADIAILACHHPPEWLADCDRERLERELATTYQAALFGHTHDPHPIASYNEHGFAFVNTTGALFQGPGWRTCFTILDFNLNDKSVKCHYRKYSAHRGVVTADTDMADDGTRIFPLGAVTASSDNLPSPQPSHSIADPVAAGREQLSSSLKLVQAPLVQDLDNAALLIEPAAYFTRDHTRLLITEDGHRVPRVPLQEWARHPGTILIFGEKGLGKTCALHWMLAQAMAEDSSRVPICMEASNLSPTVGSVKQALRSRLLSVGIRTREDLADAPPLAVAIDNLPASASKLTAAIHSVLGGLPPTPVFVGVMDDGIGAAADSCWPSSTETKTCFLGLYGSREVRMLTRTLYPLADEFEQDAIMTGALEVMVNQGLLRSPWAVVMLLLVFHYDRAFRNADVTALVDRYLDLVLGKWSADPVYGDRFDHENRKHFLSELAVFMDSSRTQVLSEQQLLEFAERYINEYGTPLAASFLVHDLISRQVLGGSPSSVKFVLGDVEQFLLATAASQGRMEIGSFLSDEERYFDAIVHFSGLGRNPLEILKRLEYELPEILSGLALPESTLFTTLDSSAWGNVPGLDDTLESLQVLGEAVGRAQSDEAQDDLADQRLIQRESPPSQEDDDEEDEALLGVRRLLQAVALLSLCLQRSDHVGDQDYRVKLVDLALRGWASVFFAACALETRVTEEERRRKSEELSDAGLNHRAIEALTQYGCFAEVAGLMEGMLASPKLGPTLRRVAVASSIPEDDMVGRLLLWVILFSGLTDGWRPVLDDLIKRFGNRPQLLFAVEMFTARKYFDATTVDADLADVEDAFVRVLIAHLDTLEANQAKGEQIQRLRGLRRLSLLSQQSETLPETLNLHS